MRPILFSVLLQGARVCMCSMIATEDHMAISGNSTCESLALLQTSSTIKSHKPVSALTSQGLPDAPSPKYLSIPEGHPLLDRLHTRLKEEEFNASIHKNTEGYFQVPFALIDSNASVPISMPHGGRLKPPMSGLQRPQELIIVGAALPRTASSSTSTALSMLGVKTQHSYQEFMGINDPRWLEMNQDNITPVHDELLKQGIEATTDAPYAFHWKEFWKLSPHAKVLLTIHPGGVEEWLTSTMDWTKSTIPQAKLPFQNRNLWERSAVQSANVEGFARMNCSINETWTEERQQLCKNSYQNYIQEVIDMVPREKLLVFNVSEGWEPLCTFLNVPTPAMSFPKVNYKT